MAILAYKSDLELVESYVSAYHIYILKDPENGKVFYVGKTMKDLKIRLSGHMGDLGNSSAKGKYLKELFDKGLKPVIEAVETIYGTCYLDKIKSSEREYYWITHFKSLGAPLTNVQGNEYEGKCNEYHGYLAAIKKGETLWQYYYCGKTRTGIPVYDEERLEEDGFSFPKGDSDEPEEEDEFKERITYVPVYDDEHPDYIRQSLEEYGPW